MYTVIATYELIAIVKKHLNLDHSLYEFLRVLDLNMFKTTPISALVGKLQYWTETYQHLFSTKLASETRELVSLKFNLIY